MGFAAPSSCIKLLMKGITVLSTGVRTQMNSPERSIKVRGILRAHAGKAPTAKSGSGWSFLLKCKEAVDPSQGRERIIHLLTRLH